MSQFRILIRRRAILLGLIGVILVSLLIVPDTMPLNAQVGPTATPRSDLSIPPCPATPICRLSPKWDLEALRKRRIEEKAAVWADGDILTVFVEAAADEVRLCCALSDSLQQISDGTAWALALKIENLDQAVISYQVLPLIRGTPASAIYPKGTYRGPNAMPAAKRIEALRGKFDTDYVQSKTVLKERQVTVYLPPGHDPKKRIPVIYMLDGQSMDGFSYVLENLIAEKRVPPTMIVGVYSDEEGFRGAEYLPGYDDARFRAHELFFVNEVRAWAEARYGASTDPKQRAVFGFSNGAVFALAMGLRYPQLYGKIIAFSPGVSPGKITKRQFPAIYLSSGTLEPPFYDNTQIVAGDLEKAGAKPSLRTVIGGHDIVVWRDIFPDAAIWAFGGKK